MMLFLNAIAMAIGYGAITVFAIYALRDLIKNIRSRYEKREIYGPTVNITSHPKVIEQEPLKMITVETNDFAINYAFLSDYCFIHRCVKQKVVYYIFFPASEFPFFQRLSGEIERVDEEFLRKNFRDRYRIVDYREKLEKDIKSWYNLVLSKIGR